MKEASQQAYARFAGIMYLLVDALDIAGVVIVARVSGTGDFLVPSHRILASETLATWWQRCTPSNRERRFRYS